MQENETGTDKRPETETGTGTGTETASCTGTDAGAGAETDTAQAEAPVLPPDEIRAVLEALIFASPQPLTPREIGKVLGGVPKEAWQAAVEEIRADYARDGRGLQLVE